MYVHEELECGPSRSNDWLYTDNRNLLSVLVCVTLAFQPVSCILTPTAQHYTYFWDVTGNNELFRIQKKYKKKQDMSVLLGKRNGSRKNSWNSGNKHLSWLFCLGNGIYCSWNAECLRMSFSLPWLWLFDTSCPVYKYVRVCVRERASVQSFISV